MGLNRDRGRARRVCQLHAREHQSPAIPWRRPRFPAQVIYHDFGGRRSSFAGGNYPDVLVYDKDYVLKYALAGSPGKGLLYNWKYHQFTAIDPFLARVQVSVTLDPTDICYGFYSYQEPDIVFTDLDVNPFTNQNVRNRIVQFFYKPHSSDPFRTIFYQILNNDGSVFLTNDPNPGYEDG